MRFGLAESAGILRIVGCAVADGYGRTDGDTERVGHVTAEHHITFAGPIASYIPMMVERFHVFGYDAGQGVWRRVDAHAFIPVGGGTGTVRTFHHLIQRFGGIGVDSAGLFTRFGRRDDQVCAVRAHFLVHLLRHGNTRRRKAEQRGSAHHGCDHGHNGS